MFYLVLQSSRAFKANFTISTKTGRTTHSNLLPPFGTTFNDDDDGCVLMIDVDESVVSRIEEEEGCDDDDDGCGCVGGGDEFGVTI